MSVRSIKKLVDKWHGIAEKSVNRSARFVNDVDIPPPDYPTSAEQPTASIKDRIEHIKAGLKNLTGKNTENER